MRHSGLSRQEGTARQSCQLEAGPTAPQPAHSPQLSLHITSCLFTALCQGKSPCQLRTAAPGPVPCDHHSRDTLACPRHPEPSPSTVSTAIHRAHSKQLVTFRDIRDHICPCSRDASQIWPGKPRHLLGHGWPCLQDRGPPPFDIQVLPIPAKWVTAVNLLQQNGCSKGFSQL